MKTQQRIRALLFILLSLALVLGSAVPSLAAGSCTFTETLVDSTRFNTPVILSWECTADGSGDVSAPTITGTGYNYERSGTITQIWIIPGTGDDLPDAAFDVELHPIDDPTGTPSEQTTVDKLADLGADCSQTDTTWGMPTNNGISQIAKQGLWPYAANCGATNKFTIGAILMPF